MPDKLQMLRLRVRAAIRDRKVFYGRVDDDVHGDFAWWCTTWGCGSDDRSEWVGEETEGYAGSLAEARMQAVIHAELHRCAMEVVQWEPTLPPNS